MTYGIAGKSKSDSTGKSDINKISSQQKNDSTIEKKKDLDNKNVSVNNTITFWTYYDGEEFFGDMRYFMNAIAGQCGNDNLVADKKKYFFVHQEQNPVFFK